jgi:hypothetical protein
MDNYDFSHIALVTGGVILQCYLKLKTEI